MLDTLMGLMLQQLWARPSPDGSTKMVCKFHRTKILDTAHCQHVIRVHLTLIRCASGHRSMPHPGTCSLSLAGASTRIRPLGLVLDSSLTQQSFLPLGGSLCSMAGLYSSEKQRVFSSCSVKAAKPTGWAYLAFGRRTPSALFLSRMPGRRGQRPLQKPQSPKHIAEGQAAAC